MLRLLRIRLWFGSVLVFFSVIKYVFYVFVLGMTASLCFVFCCCFISVLPVASLTRRQDLSYPSCLRLGVFILGLLTLVSPCYQVFVFWGIASLLLFPQKFYFLSFLSFLISFNVSGCWRPYVRCVPVESSTSAAIALSTPFGTAWRRSVCVVV